MAVKRCEANIDVVKAAEIRIKNVFGNGLPVFFSFSGGKDSLCVAQLMVNLANRGEIDMKQLTVQFIDEEAIFPCMEDMTKKWRRIFMMMGAKFEWYCVEVKHFNCLGWKEMMEMAVYKDNATGTWRVIYRFTNWKGERKQTQKRGFATKREAQAWEHEVMLKQNSKLDMTFASFFELYEADKKQRVKESTWESKSHVIRTKILPYFGNRKIAEIEAKDIIAWQGKIQKVV